MPTYLNPDYRGEERYSVDRLFRWVDGIYDSLDSVYVRELQALPAAGEHYLSDEAYRPDLLAHRLYGSDQAWTIPLIYNGLISEEQLVRGLRIRYPRLSDVENLYFQMVGKTNTRG